MKFYFTFGFDHTHRVKGFTYDKDVVVEIEAEDSGHSRDIMFEYFQDKWSMQYNDKPEMKYFPRGIKQFDIWD